MGFIYVCSFDNGATKVGNSGSNPSGRISSHIVKMRKIGAKITNSYTSMNHGNYAENESELISKLNVNFKKLNDFDREWFLCSYDDAITEVSRLTFESNYDYDAKHKISEKINESVQLVFSETKEIISNKNNKQDECFESVIYLILNKWSKLILPQEFSDEIRSSLSVSIFNKINSDNYIFDAVTLDETLTIILATDGINGVEKYILNFID